MWTRENRGLYDRKGLRYPSDLSDPEWALIEPFIPPAKRGGRKREVDVREVLNGILYVLGTGCQWRALPKDLPPKSTAHNYFRLWEWDGTLERIGLVPQKFRIPISFTLPPFQTREGFSRLASNVCVVDCRSH